MVPPLPDGACGTTGAVATVYDRRSLFFNKSGAHRAPLQHENQHYPTDTPTGRGQEPIQRPSHHSPGEDVPRSGAGEGGPYFQGDYTGGKWGIYLRAPDIFSHFRDLAEERSADAEIQQRIARELQKLHWTSHRHE